MTTANNGSVYVLTSAELALLVLLAGERSGVADLLAIPRLTGLDDPMAAAGLQSLVVRDLAGFEGENLTVEPEVATIGVAVASATASFVLGCRSDTDAFGARLVESDLASLWLTPRAPGLIRASILGAATARTAVLTDAALELVTRGAKSVVAIGVEYPAEGDNERGLELRQIDGEIEYRLTQPPAQEEKGRVPPDVLLGLLSRL